MRPEAGSGPADVPSDGAPFGMPEMLSAVGDAPSVLDLGCGSGRLTVALARRGASATGIDVDRSRLRDAEARARAAGVALRLVAADLNEPLPFPDASFAAATSRLSLMLAHDPAATLREVARTLAPGAPVVSAVWAEPAQNPWFGEPRAAVGDALGAERRCFARAFGRLGSPEALAAPHRAAGLGHVRTTLVADRIRVADAAAHWHELIRWNGRFAALAATLSPAEEAAVLTALAARLRRFASADGVLLPRTLVVTVARVA